MKILYLDCYAGISGDMSVAALLDLGVPLDHLRSELDKLGLPPDSYEISISHTERQQVAALKFDVAVKDIHTHRQYSEIDAIIAGSALSGKVKETARKIFHRLAEAEAFVHGVAIEDVHFHEVGAVDSIIDIVGTAICLDYLGVDDLYASATPLGSGFVETSHGRLPIPAPATVELLKGLPLHGDCGEGERVTPTGAAIVAALASGFGKHPAMLFERVGNGAGRKEFPDCPNILRAFLGRIAEKKGDDGVVVVEANIDDSTPEVLGYTMERLLEEGALDVFFTPIQMKKNRPAAMISFLCYPDQFKKLAQLLLIETSTIGLRHYRVDRIVLERRSVEEPTEFGMVQFKQLIDDDGKIIRSSPEYGDCCRIAREKGIPCREVMAVLNSGGGTATMTKAAVEMESIDLDDSVADLLRKSKQTLSLAESCSGGLIAKRITDVPGSSAYFTEGVVTYSNAAKMRLLHVPAELLNSFGAVSPECAAVMAKGIRRCSGSDLALATTGIAGPDGGSGDKPVGTVYISLATPDGFWTKRFQFSGGRDEVRNMTAFHALDWLKSYLLNLAETK